jgi:hypothetical protein
VAEPADIVSWLCRWIPAALATRVEGDVVASDREPAPGEPWPELLIVVRDDGRIRTSAATGTQSVGFNIYAGDRLIPKKATDIGRALAAVLERPASTDASNPITALRGMSGPRRVTDPSARGRAYLAATFAVANQ